MQGVLGGVRGRGYTVVRKKVHIRVSVNIYSGGNFALPQDEQGDWRPRGIRVNSWPLLLNKFLIVYSSVVCKVRNFP